MADIEYPIPVVRFTDNGTDKFKIGIANLPEGAYDRICKAFLSGTMTNVLTDVVNDMLFNNRPPKLMSLASLLVGDVILPHHKPRAYYLTITVHEYTETPLRLPTKYLNGFFKVMQSQGEREAWMAYLDKLSSE